MNWVLTIAVMLLQPTDFVVREVRYATFQECYAEQLMQTRDNMQFVLTGGFIAICAEKK